MTQLLDILRLGCLFLCSWGAGCLAEEKLGWPALVAEIIVGMILGPNGLDQVPFVDALTVIGQAGLLLIVLEGGLHIELASLMRVGWRAFAVALSGTCLPVVACIAVLAPLPDFSFQDALVAGTALSSTAIGMAAKLMADLGLLDKPLGQFICCAAMIDDVASLVLLAIIANLSSSTSSRGKDGEDDENEGGDGGDGGGNGSGGGGGAWAVLLPLVTSVAFLAVSVGVAAGMPRIVKRIEESITQASDNSVVGGGGGGGGTVAVLATSSPNTAQSQQRQHQQQRSQQQTQIQGGREEEGSSVVNPAAPPSPGPARRRRKEPAPEVRDEDDDDDGSVDGSKKVVPPRFLLPFILAVAAGMTTAAHYSRTTPLLGCFMAGVAFASCEGGKALACWDQSVPPVAGWLSRLFFASIGFAVPVKELFSGKAVGYGLLVTAIAVLSKLVTGCWEWSHKWTVGWAMVGRGELGFVMATEAHRTHGLISKLTFAVTVWALLLATLISPVAFRRVVNSRSLDTDNDDDGDGDGNNGVGVVAGSYAGAGNGVTTDVELVMPRPRPSSASSGRQQKRQRNLTPNKRPQPTVEVQVVEVASSHLQNHLEHVNSVLPERVSQATARRVCGHTFSKEAWDRALAAAAAAASAEITAAGTANATAGSTVCAGSGDGCISREEFLNDESLRGGKVEHRYY